MSDVNCLKIKIQDLIAHVNESFSKFDDKNRTFLFLDWTPLNSLNETPECRFWQECINLYQLFQECMPGFYNFYYDNQKISIDDKFYIPLGYSKYEIGNLHKLFKNLRLIRIYRCHAFMDITEHQTRLRHIRSFLMRELELSLENNRQISQGIMFLSDDDDKWDKACERLYEIAIKQINILNEKISGFDYSSTPELINVWRIWYSNWYASKDMRKDYLKSALYSFNDFCKENNRVPHEFDYDKIVRDLKLIPIEEDRYVDQYLEMFDDAKNFHPFALTYDMIVHIYGEEGRSYCL